MTRAPSTPRTTRNSRGLRRTEGAGNTPARRTRVARRPRTSTPPPPTSPLSVTPTRPLPSPSPSPPSSPSSLVLSAPPSPSAPPPAPASAGPATPVRSSPSLSPAPSLLSAIQRRDRDRIWSLRVSFPVGLQPRRALPPSASSHEWSREETLRLTRRHIPGVRTLPKLLPSSEREARLFKSIEEQEGEKFGRELYTAIRNDRFLKRCTCHLPNIYGSKEEAEGPEARGHFRFFVFGENEDQLGAILRTNDYRDGCKCDRHKIAPVYYNILNVPVFNQNGKRPAEDSELDLLAEATEQGRPTEVVRIVAAPVDPVPGNQTRRRRMTSYLQRKLDRIRTMGNSVLTMFGRFNRNGSAAPTEAVDTRRIDTETNSLTVKRFKRQVCLPANATGPSVDLQELPYLNWAEDVTKYIGADMIWLIHAEFQRQINVINSGFICGGVSVEAIRANVKTNEDLDLSIAVHRLMCERVGTFTAQDSGEMQANYFSRAKAIYLRGLLGITQFMQFAYDAENIARLQTEIPVPKTPLLFGDYHFRNDTRHGADFLAWLVRSGQHPQVQDAVSKIFMDAKAIHKQELPPSFVYHPGTDDHPLMPGSFPISVYDEIPMDSITIDPVHALKHPSSDPNPPVKGRDFKIARQPKGILKIPKEWPQAPPSPEYVPVHEKRRKLVFGSPAATYLPPKNIPNKTISVNEAITEEYLAAEFLGNRFIERADSMLSIVTHTRLGLISPSNYTAVRQFNTDEEQARGDDERMKLRYHATKYGSLLRDISKINLNLEATELVRQPEPADPSFGNQTIQTEGSDEAAEAAVIDEKDQRVSHGLIQDDLDMMEQDYNPEVPNVAAALHKARLEKEALRKKVATREDRRKFLDEFFARGGYDDADDTIPARSPLNDTLEISTSKRDEFEINRQIVRELEEAAARQVREKQQRELEAELRRQQEEERRIQEEKRRQFEEDRRELEEELRREEEARQRDEQDRKRAAEAKRRKEAAQYAAMTGLRAPSRPIIIPLSQDWNEKVEKAGRANPQTDLAKMLDGTPLRRHDLTQRLLPKEAWLNDTVIIGSIMYIADYVNNAAGVNGKLNPKCSALSSFFWTRLKQHGLNSCARVMRNAGIRKENFLEIDTILIPICEHDHWTLGVVCPTKRTVSHVDSMRAGASDPAIANKLIDWVKATLGDTFVESDWETITYRSPKQSNGYDCGVFTVTNAVCLALGVDPTEAYSPNQLTLQRRRLAAILLNGGFKGEFTLDGL